MRTLLAAFVGVLFIGVGFYLMEGDGKTGWDPLEADFQEGLERLKEYVAREVTARVPQSFKEERMSTIELNHQLFRDGYHVSGFVPQQQLEEHELVFDVYFDNTGTLQELTADYNPDLSLTLIALNYDEAYSENDEFLPFLGTLSKTGDLSIFLPTPLAAFGWRLEDFVNLDQDCSNVLIDPSTVGSFYAVNLEFFLERGLYSDDILTLTPKHWKLVHGTDVDTTTLVYFYQDTKIKGSCTDEGFTQVFDIDAPKGWSYVRDLWYDDSWSWTSVSDPSDEWFLQED